METMKRTTRLSCDERKEAILEAVKAVFARKGFDGTTTRDLAQAAGVSEALIFKHFPDKESLFEAMVGSCAAKALNDPSAREVMALEPSTSALVLLTHFLVTRMIGGSSEDDTISRLMAWSLLKDGDFARVKVKSFADHLLPKLEQCIKAAQKAGDLADIPVRSDLRIWFTHHIAGMINVYRMPESKPLDYKASKSELAEQVTWFALLGMGMKPDTVKKHYHPKALSLLAG